MANTLDYAPAEKRSGYAWELVALLWFALFLNQADRQVFNVVLPLLKKDIGLSDPHAGLVGSILIWTLAALVPLAGYAGDRLSKKWIITLSLLFWSSATLLTGLSRNLAHLILFRSLATGGGEAFYVSAANALISQHHPKSRALAMSIHQTAVYVGIIASGVVGGYIGEHYGWRNAFYAFGGFGVILAAVLALRLETDTPAQQPGDKPASLASAFGLFVRTPTALLLSAAFAGMVFANIGYLTWMPTFLHERFGMSVTSAGFNSMFYHHAAAFAGVLIGGKLADPIAARKPAARLWIQAAALLIGGPFIALMGLGPSAVLVYVGLAGFGLFRGFYDSNLFASLYEVIPARYRSSATGLMTMFAFVVGAVASYLLGALKPRLGLAWGLAGLGAVYIAAAVCIAIAAVTVFHRDRSRSQEPAHVHA